MKTSAELIFLLAFGLAADATTTTAAEFVPRGPAERVEAVSFDGNTVVGSLINDTLRRQ